MTGNVIFPTLCALQGNSSFFIALLVFNEKWLNPESVFVIVAGIV